MKITGSSKQLRNLRMNFHESPSAPVSSRYIIVFLSVILHSGKKADKSVLLTNG
jgi:hypothetical protein